jgi:hypothetical protein
VLAGATFWLGNSSVILFVPRWTHHVAAYLALASLLLALRAESRLLAESQGRVRALSRSAADAA